MFNAYRVINSVDPNPLIPWDLITVGFLNNKLTNEYVKRTGDVVAGDLSFFDGVGTYYTCTN
jgi:hypothetical protein